MREDSHLYRQLTNLKTYLTVALFGGSGLLLIVIAGGLNAFPTGQTVVRNVGSFLIATMVPALLWELFAKRNLLKEVDSRINLPPAAYSSGLLDAGVHHSWLDAVDLENPERIDLLFGLYEVPYWNGREGKIVRKALERVRSAGGTVRLAFPSPESRAVLELLCLGRGTAVEGPALNQISQDLKAFKGKLVEKRPANAGEPWNLEIYLLATLPGFGYFRLDDKAVVALDTHRGLAEPDRAPLVLSLSEGEVLRFFAAEFETLVGDSRLRTPIYR